MSKISNDLAKQLMESSNWDSVKTVNLTESATPEVIEEDSVDEDLLTEDETGELAEAIDKGDVHVCPLCETILAEEISDELVESHMEFVAGILAEDADSSDDE